MSRKRKKKKSNGDWTTTSLAPSHEAEHEAEDLASAAEESAEDAPASRPANGAAAVWTRHEKSRLPGESEQRVELGTPAPPAASGDLRMGNSEIRSPDRKEQESVAKPEEDRTREGRSGGNATEDKDDGGLMSKITRWWRKPSPVTVRIPSTPPGGSPRIPTPPRIAEPKPAEPKERPAAQSSSSVPSAAPSAVSQSGLVTEEVHAILMLERVKDELASAKKSLQEERETSKAKIVQLEAERDHIRANAERSRTEKGDIEGHTSVLRKSVTALERQLEEEKRGRAAQEEQQASRIVSLEEALKNSGAASAAQRDLQGNLEEAREQRERAESLLEEMKSEHDAAQRHFEEERAALQERIRQMESDLARKGGANEMANAERARIEERAALVQKALDVLEQQLREEREAAGSQIQQLETERDQIRAKCAQLETRVGSLIEELESRRPRKKGEKARAPEAEVPEAEESQMLTTRAEARIQTLENELATAHAQVSQEKQSTTTRIQRLESRWEELKSRLLPKDREISELRQQTDQFRSQVQQLESALTESRKKSEGKSDGPAAAQSASGIVALSPEGATALYHQSMARLTVLMASADIVLMNPRLEAGMRESAQDIKAQSQSLLELIKAFTLPPETQKNN